MKRSILPVEKKSRTAEELQCGLAEEETRLVANLAKQEVQPSKNLTQTVRYVLLVGSTPGLVLPADRLRAALPVGTNRAPSECFVLSPGYFRNLYRSQRITLERKQCQILKIVKDFTQTLENRPIAAILPFLWHM